VFAEAMPDVTTAGSVPQAMCRSWLGSREVVLGPLAGAGFSGAQVWRVRSGADQWVLKSWAAGAAVGGAGGERIAWVHALMRHLRRRGMGEVLEPLTTIEGGTATVDAEGIWWELLPFIPGRPTGAPTAPQAAAAAACLARLHVAAESFSAAPPGRGIPAALQRRIAAARRLIESPWADRAIPNGRGSSTPLQRAVAQRLATAAEIFASERGDRAIRRAAALQPPEMPLQAVLRDVWSDHVLYAETDPSRVVGVVDFHAAAIDTPATDIARLFGSWQSDAGGPQAAIWSQALEAYEGIRPLRTIERGWIRWLHATGVVFGLDNWFRWTLAESREFVRPAAVIGRLDRLLAALPAALADVVDGDIAAV
jgi:Ser/Thr protein kinase RdoA (MazF antagonist)